MRLAIFGVGGVGGYFGGRLAQSGQEVAFVARGQHLAAMREQGLIVESSKGDFAVRPTLATDNPAEVGIVDAVIVATKAWQVMAAAEQMRPMIGENTVIVPLLNGVEAPDQLAAVYGQEKVLGGFCGLLSWIDAPGKVHQEGIEPYVALGEMDQQVTPRVETLLQVFLNAGIKTSVPPDIRASMWQKFLFIASLSGVGAVTRVPAGILRSIPESRQMLRDAMDEVATVAYTHGIRLAADAVERGLAQVDNLPPQATASMQRDVMEGRPSELEAQNGAVVRLGREVNTPAPTHEFIYRSLLPMEKVARGEIQPYERR